VGAGKARVVGPSGGKVKVWRVEVGRDGDGAFLGRGWPEIAAAFGVGDGWFLVLQHHGGSVLTLKAFDASGCIRGLVTPPTGKKGFRLIPAKFVEHYIPEEHKNSRMAMVIGSLGKICRVELEMNESNLFLRGGWSQVLVSHDVTQANALLLKYEGNTVFTVKVFGPDGFQRESKDKDIRIQQGEQKINPSMVVFESVSSGYKCETSMNSTESWKVGGLPCKNNSFVIARGWMMFCRENSLKEGDICTFNIVETTLWHVVITHNKYLPYAFCDAIGLREPRTITLKTSMSNTRSWQVLVVPNKNSSHYVRGLDWKRFCEENEIKVGDVCTISIVETTLWHVVVARQ
ncbi:hypothetical protein SETIT_7G053800v2, partial [Setaria italica]